MTLILVLVLVLAISIVLFVSANSSNSKKTIGDIEAEVNKYIISNYPDMVIGSSEYVDYLCEQLLFESDEEATKLDNYSDFRFYASYYLGSANNPDMTEEVEVDGNEPILRFKEHIKRKAVDDVKKELRDRELKDTPLLNSESAFNRSNSISFE
jgi:hypothetical protein